MAKGIVVLKVFANFDTLKTFIIKECEEIFCRFVRYLKLLLLNLDISVSAMLNLIAIVFVLQSAASLCPQAVLIIRIDA